MRKKLALFLGFCLAVQVLPVSAAEIQRPSNERIAQLQESIARDCRQKQFLYSCCINGLKLAGIAAMAYGTYQFASDQPMIEKIVRRMEPEQLEKLVAAGHAILVEDAVVQVARPGWFHWFKDSAKSLIPTVVISQLFGRLLASVDNRIEDVFADHTIDWFIARRTSLHQVLRELKLTAAACDPESSIFQALSILTIPAQAAQRKMIVNELVQLRATALAAQTASDRADYQQQLIVAVNHLVPEVEKLVAFVQFAQPDQVDLAQSIIQATNDLCDNMQQAANGAQDVGVLAVMFNYAAVLERSVAHIQLLEKQPEITSVAAEA